MGNKKFALYPVNAKALEMEMEKEVKMIGSSSISILKLYNIGNKVFVPLGVTI